MSDPKHEINGITHYIDWALPDTGMFPVTNIYSKTLMSNNAIDGEDRWHGRLLIAHHDRKYLALYHAI